MAAKTTSKQETNKGFYHLLIMQFKQVFNFAKIKNLPWWIKTVIFLSNYQISIGSLLCEVHIDAWTNLEPWNGGNDFGICQWRLINKFSALNKVKIYSHGSKRNKIGDEYGRTYYFRSFKGRNAGGMSKWCYLSKFSF